MFKKLSLALVIPVLALAIALMVLPQGNVAQAQFEVVEVTVTGTTTMLPMQSYVLTSTGWNTGETVDFLVGGVRVGRGTADGTGQVTDSVKVPSLTARGTQAVVAQNLGGTLFDSYNATVNPILVLGATQGGAGSSLDVRGYALDATEAYTIYFTDNVDTGEADCMNVAATVTETVGTGTTTTAGTFKKNVTVPSVGEGTYYFVAIGATSATCAED